MTAQRIISILSTLIFLIFLVACAPEDTQTWNPRTDADVDNDTVITVADEDADGISDENEGRSSNRDTDGDGTPDYLDTDSDDDNIPDAWESGTSGDPSIDPRDSDDDGTPDFIDVDSDDNGLFDLIEGYGDTDEDGLGDWRDPDNDGDRINDVDEIGDVPSNPNDFDEDGLPDYMDYDSDDDMISDYHEHFEDDRDPDEDGEVNRFDEDSDDDGIPDSIEAGDDDLETVPIDTDGDTTPDYLDLDSDADGLSDELEWLHAADMGTDFRNADSDGDGVSDMVEWAAETDIGDPADNPRARGDFVFVVPWQEDPRPEKDTLDFETAIQIADVYFLMDRTGSMSEIGVMSARLSEIIDSVTCADDEDPVLTGCIPNLWVGFGWFTETNSPSSYTNIRNLTADYAGVQASIPATTTGGDDECQRKAIFCAAHGPGGSCPGDASNLDTFPCPPDHVGYPCYRPDAARVLVAFTDEDMDQDRSPDYSVVGNALIDSSITFVGINAQEGGSSSVDDDLRAVARASGQAAGSELVFRGDGAGVVAAVVSAIDAAARIPFDVGAQALDDTSDTVDATQFIDYLESNVFGSDICTGWDDVTDSDGDTHPDRFLGIPPGTPVCWDVHPAENNFVEATEVPQMFMATIVVRGGPGETLLDERDVYFLVPPVFYDPDIDPI